MRDRKKKKMKSWVFVGLHVSVPTTKGSPTRGCYWAKQYILHQSVCLSGLKKKREKKTSGSMIVMTSLWCTVLNVFLYLVVVENSDASPAHTAPLVEKPWLESPIAEQIKLFSEFLWGRSVEKGGGGGSAEMKSGIASYLDANAVISCTLRLSSFTHGVHLRSHVELFFLSFPPLLMSFLMTLFTVQGMYLRDAWPLRKQGHNFPSLCPCWSVGGAEGSDLFGRSYDGP